MSRSRGIGSTSRAVAAPSPRHPTPARRARRDERRRGDAGDARPDLEYSRARMLRRPLDARGGVDHESNGGPSRVWSCLRRVSRTARSKSRDGTAGSHGSRSREEGRRPARRRRGHEDDARESAGVARPWRGRGVCRRPGDLQVADDRSLVVCARGRGVSPFPVVHCQSHPSRSPKPRERPLIPRQAHDAPASPPWTGADALGARRRVAADRQIHGDAAQRPAWPATSRDAPTCWTCVGGQPEASSLPSSLW